MSVIIELCADCGASVEITAEVAVRFEVDRAMGEDTALVCERCMSKYVCPDCGEVER